MSTEVAMELSTEKIAEIEAGQSRLLQAAQSLVIDSLDAEKVGWDIVNGIAALKKVIEADFGPTKKAAHGAWKAVCAQEAGHLSMLKQPDQIVRGKLSDWEAEKRLAQAEKERKAREEAALAEKTRREAEEKRLAAAIAAEEKGDTATAEELLDAAAEEPPPPEPVIEAPPPKVDGAGAMVEVWHYEIEDAQALPREFLMPNLNAIQGVVHSLKAQTKIPGVRVWTKLEPRRTSRR